MRVFLIYPPISMWERYSSDIGHAGGRQMPLGIHYLAAYAREQGHQTAVADGEALGLSPVSLAEKAAEFRADVVGIGATTVAFHRARETAQAVKSVLPGATIVLGGAHVTALPAESLVYEEFDYGIAGEGEIALARLLETLENHQDPSDVPGLVFREPGRVRVNPRGPFIADLDRLPFPAYDLVPDMSVYNPPPANYRKAPVANVLTGRGCPNQCTFCDRSLFGRTPRSRSPENVADEIEYLVRRRGVREIAFVDENFTIRPRLVYELFDTLGRRGLRFPWTCMSRVDTVDQGLLKFMKAHGCWHVSLGIESGDGKILERIRKRVTPERVRQTVAWCRRAGIRTKGFFMVGHPGETKQTIETTIRFALETPLDDVVVTFNTPLPGTEQYRTAPEFGALENADWSGFNMWRPVFVPHGLTARFLVEKHREFYRRFYVRPRIMARFALGFLSRSGPRRAAALARGLPFLVKNLGRNADRVEADGN